MHHITTATKTSVANLTTVSTTTKKPPSPTMATRCHPVQEHPAIPPGGLPSTTTVWPTRRYGTLLIDPPWRTDQVGGYGASQHYNLMSLERIAGLPLSELAAEDAHLWLWVTRATQERAYQLIRDWGFTFRSDFQWIKPVFGLGHYLRTAHETMLLATRGKAPARFRSQPSWTFAPRQDHSHKPEEQYAIIERFSPGPYLELFARRPQPGWDAWGNQIDSDIVIPGYPVPSDTRHRNTHPTGDTSASPEATPGGAS